jgi:phospholipase/carboxylesterase
VSDDPAGRHAPGSTGASGPHAGGRVAVAGASLGEGSAVMIMIHGRGAAPENILDLVHALDRPGFTYLAPAASGGAWYPRSFMAPREANEPWLSSGLSVIRAQVDEALAAGVERESLILLGFSQGACLATEFAFRHPARYGGVIAYSGGLIGPPGATWKRSGSFEGTPVFFGCSDIDPHIPEERVHESARVFGDMEAEVTKRIYPGMGHLVNDDEITFTRELMEAVVSG